MEHEIHTNPDWIHIRQGALLEAGWELDVVTGEPIMSIEITAVIS
jgi:hypothetical protein